MRQFVDSFMRTENFIFPSNVYLTPSFIKGSVQHMYDTMDMIDLNLKAQQSSKLSSLIELANFSSMVGNLIGAGCQIYSNGWYYRNRPHTYPDLLATNPTLPGIEIKTALGRNRPKGHQPKPGYYLTYRYRLTDENGLCIPGQEEIWDTITIWEIKFGLLSIDDFSCSNTEGDSGKTAVIKSDAFNNMKLLYLDTNIIPYRHSIENPYSGFN